MEASADSESEAATIEGDQTSLGVAFILRDVDICPPGSDKPLVTGKFERRGNIEEGFCTSLFRIQEHK